jgi:transposase
MRDGPATRAYLTRRRAEGKTNREIRRCLKRYIARQLYRVLTATMRPAPASAENSLTNTEAER